MASKGYYIRRVFQAGLTMFAVVSLSFFMIRLMPGGPITSLKVQMANENQGRPPTPEELNRRAELLYNIQASDDPLYVQYLDYMINIVQGDFGTSIFNQEPVWDVMGPAIPWTFFLFSTAILINFFLGIGIGALMAWYEGTNFDVATSVTGITLTSIPYYAVALMLLYVLAYQYSVFPTGGRYDHSLTPGFSVPFIRSLIYHAALPLLSVIIGGWAGRALAMRGNSIRVLGEDYLRVAQMRGLSDSRIAVRYVMRNAVLPMYTGLMIGIAGVFGGSVILETIFRYKGMGYWLFQAVINRDYPLMMGSLILFTIITVLGILLADLTYGWIDPRASAGGEDREAY